MVVVVVKEALFFFIERVTAFLGVGGRWRRVWLV